jgi:hypothetical protein
MIRENSDALLTKLRFLCSNAQPKDGSKQEYYIFKSTRHIDKDIIAESGTLNPSEYGFKDTQATASNCFNIHDSRAKLKEIGLLHDKKIWPGRGVEIILTSCRRGNALDQQAWLPKLRLGCGPSTPASSSIFVTIRAEVMMSGDSGN